MADTSALLASQKPDGGWPYQSGSSWTEPTAYALLALVACGEAASPAVKNGCEWLARNQRADGGWAPRPTVDQSTWVTALILLLPGMEVKVRRDAALQWLCEATGRETSWIQRARSALLDGHIRASDGDGWPWFPDTAAWVTPTSFSLLALEKAAREHGSPEFDKRSNSGRQYLLSHTCRDAGWNHGSTKALGYDSDSYPETTGQALLALHDVPGVRLERSIECAERHFESCQSFEACCWLKLGLMVHGRTIPDRPPPKSHGTVMETALVLLVRAAADGRNIFLE
jgi:hypothetical protein